MRIVKVKAWNEDSSSFVRADLVELENMKLVDSRGLDLVWYTGLKDKNGTEIFEGDILQYPGCKSIVSTCFLDGCFVVRPKIVHEEELLSRASGIDDHDGEAVVIGSIYENPELLEQEK